MRLIGLIQNGKGSARGFLQHLFSCVIIDKQIKILAGCQVEPLISLDGFIRREHTEADMEPATVAEAISRSQYLWLRRLIEIEATHIVTAPQTEAKPWQIAQRLDMLDDRFIPVTEQRLLFILGGGHAAERQISLGYQKKTTGT